MFTWNSLLGTGETRIKRFPIAVIKKSDIIAGTLDAIMKVIGWSFNVMATGVEPPTDWEGRPIEHEPMYLAQGGVAS